MFTACLVSTAKPAHAWMKRADRTLHTRGRVAEGTMEQGQLESAATPAMTPPDVSEELDAYRRELRDWIDQRRGNDTTLYLAGRALCNAAAARAVPPEQLLIALHAGCVMPFWSGPDARADAARETRYRSAIRLLLRTYFGIESRRGGAAEHVR
jgi:hypothetical protein